MAFIEQELRNFSAKGWLGILGTGDRDTAPDNLTWYEELTTNDLIVKPGQIWGDYATIPPAPNLIAAQAAAVAFPLIIADYSAPASAIHLTPSPNNKVFFATSVFGDLTTRMRNWIMPQIIPRTDLGWEGFPSVGYMIKLYNGDPSLGGVEITTSQEQAGAIVGWWMNFGAGAIKVASSFASIVDPNDIWMTGFQYIGAEGSGGGSSGITGTPIRVGAEDIDGAINTIDTDISLYIVPASTYPAKVKIVAVNRNSGVIPAVRIAHVDGAIGAVSDEDYLMYDVLLQPNEPKFLEIDGMTSGDSILVRSNSVGVNFIATALYQSSDTGLKRIAATTVLANTDTVLFSAAGAEYENCSIMVCNRDSANAATYRIALIDGAIGALTVEDYIVFDEIILENEGFAFSEIFHIPNGYTIAVRASDSDVNFVLFGQER